jgi:hypothetical protein
VVPLLFAGFERVNASAEVRARHPAS